MRAISSSAEIVLGARARGLAADVDEVGAARLHLDRRRLGRAGIEIETAIGERIGRDVEDAHDERAVAELKRAVRREAGRVKWARGVTK